MIRGAINAVVAGTALCMAGPGQAQEAVFANGVDITDGTASSSDLFVDGDASVDGRACIGRACVDDMILNNAGTPIVFVWDTAPVLGLRAGTSGNNGFDLETVDLFGTGELEFYISDADAATTPFAIGDNAPSSALFIEGITGDIGLGTVMPETSLHLAPGGVPIIRFDQSTQVWDLYGNTGQFGLSDETGGGVTPFAVEIGAPQDAFFIETVTGDIGFGTSGPSAALHIRRSDGSAKLRIEEMDPVRRNNRIQLEMVNNGAAQFALIDTDTDTDWRFQNFEDQFRVNKAGTGVTEMTLDAAGNMTILGALTQNSDKNAKMDIVAVDPALILEKVAALPVAEWSYSDTAGVRHIGPMAQDFRALFGTGASDTGISTLDTSGVALAAIQALTLKNGALEETVAVQNRVIAGLEARLAALETVLAER